MIKTNSGYENTFYDEYIQSTYFLEGHYLLKIKDFVKLDFLEPLLRNSYKNRHSAGRDPIDPRTLFMVLLLEYLENLSDLKVVEKLKLIPLYRFFVGLSPEDKIPDDTTLSYFRTQRLGEEKTKAALNQVVKQLFAAGLIDGKIQTQDATDVRADAASLMVFQLISKCRKNLFRAVENISTNKANKLREKFAFEILRKPSDKQKHFEELLENTKKLVTAVRNSNKLLKDEGIQKELAIMQRVLEEREDEIFDEEGKKQPKPEIKKITGKMVNPSDPDASWGAKSDKNFFFGYKTMLNVDHKYGVITDAEVEKAGHPEEKSAAQLLARQKENIGIIPDHFTADAKYDAGNTRAEIKAVGAPEKNINLYIPLIPTKNKEGGFRLDSFFFEEGNLVCPAGYPAEYAHADDKKMGFEFKFNAAICARCPLRSECTDAEFGRKVLISHTQMERKIAADFNASEHYQIMYGEQHWKIEPRNADLKKNQGLKRSRYRGLSRTRIHAYLSVMANNLKKYCKIITGKIKEGITNTLAKLIALGPPGERVCPDAT